MKSCQIGQHFLEAKRSPATPNFAAASLSQPLMKQATEFQVSSKLVAKLVSLLAQIHAGKSKDQGG